MQRLFRNSNSVTNSANIQVSQGTTTGVLLANKDVASLFSAKKISCQEISRVCFSVKEQEQSIQSERIARERQMINNLEAADTDYCN